MNEAGRVFGLDLLRALAISFVVAGHAGNLMPAHFPHHFFKYFIFDGVTIFFVLSGFLIGRILLRTFDDEPLTHRTLLNFWIRRWFRTLPAYYLVLVLLVMMTKAIADDTPPLPDSIFLYFAFAQNLAWEHPEYFGEAWSLAVEEWFYLLVPIPLYLASRIGGPNRGKLILACIFSVVVSVTVVRLVWVAHVPPTTVTEWDYALKMQVIMRMDSLMFGVLGAYLSLYARPAWDRAGRVSLVIGALLLVFDQLMRNGDSPLPYLNYFALTVTPIATLMLLPVLSRWRCNPNPVANTVTFISLISYSMYLLNQGPILETFLPWLMPRLMQYLWRFSDYTLEIRFVLFLTLTLGGSYILHRFYEKPMMQLRDRGPFRSRVRKPTSAISPT